tara:strand:- start:322 stop:522 length:201 start_codon:yes stop_codon:yes gene_type:complete
LLCKLPGCLAAGLGDVQGLFGFADMGYHIKALPAKLDSSPEYLFGKLASMCLRCDSFCLNGTLPFS